MKCKTLQISNRFAYNEKEKYKSKNTKTLKIKRKKFHITLRIILFFKYIIYFFILKRYCKNIVSDINPDIILQGPYHSCGTFDNVIHRIAKMERIKSICYPVSAYSGKGCFVW